MKINYGKILAYWMLLIWSIITVLWLTSCAAPNPKKQKKHYDKFLYYGGKIDTVKQTITKEVLVKGKDGKDSLIYVQIECDVPTPKIEYRDRWHIRRMDKQERDSFKHVENVLRLQIKAGKHSHRADGKALAEQTKQIAIQHKADKIKALRGLLLVIGFVLLLIAAIIYLIKR
jgi:hypothetical protein